MTTVTWEREPGEKVEEFVAALLLLKYPHGNQPTPSKGDRGVDVRVENPDGFDIYQVKRYSRPLTAGQARKIEASWNTFVSQTLPVRSWTLVTPWQPTNPRLDWLAGDGGQRLARLMAEALQGGREVPPASRPRTCWTPVVPFCTVTTSTASSTTTRPQQNSPPKPSSTEPDACSRTPATSLHGGSPEARDRHQPMAGRP
ncbi:hypothetical protein ACFPOI_59965 [Nonomuraea angiospora]|uniref:Restriction endonuclease type IV Mrr domain-containing protein n=1 Tax=Nonomuraea angiospora TaxID=46172 RepID=A0ABR9LQ27_9ACTN|nr:hypothetical protein [Nonomuraea angiospora]MBE1582759.1 hypothetical protein [Nonomuraea angiospora]